MTKEMIISSSAHETRVAILEDDQVAEIFIEREHQRGVVGNLYKGRLSKALAGWRWASVDLGLDGDAFLYVSDVVAPSGGFDRLETEDEEDGGSAAGGNGPSGGPRPTHAVRRPGPADGVASGGGPRAPPTRRGRPGRERGPEPKIQGLLKEGQETVVQGA